MRWRRLSSPAAAEDAPTSFETAVLPHLDAAHNLARWLVGDASFAQDVVQEAVLRALDYFDTYRGGDARSWLLRIVRNTAHSLLAARHRRRAASLDDTGPEGDAPALEVPDPGHDPEAALARRQGLDRLDDALAALPLELRECLVLRELEGFSYKDIARVTETPIGTVMSRLWRARRALTQRLEEGETA
ncbi:MAG TPA: sigma-70 family RNA polymerase sigma factor [Roseomonas sp.]